jgi:hypothetical protein
MDRCLEKLATSTQCPSVQKGPPCAQLTEHPTHHATDSHRPAVTARSYRRALFRLQNPHGLPLQPPGDGSDPEVVLRECADDHVHMRRVLCQLRGAVLEQIGKDQTDRLRNALADGVKALSA